MKKKLHPNYERWIREGKRRGPLVRTTFKTNSINVPPITDLELDQVYENGSALVSIRSIEGVLLDGEWQFIRPERGKAS